jgi:hypothetical protein
MSMRTCVWCACVYVVSTHVHVYVVSTHVHVYVVSTHVQVYVCVRE